MSAKFWNRLSFLIVALCFLVLACLPSEGATLTLAPVVLNAPVSSAYSLQLTPGGGTSTYTCTLAPGSALPDGLNISSDCLISGTPSVQGNFDPVIQVIDSAATPNWKQFHLKISIGPATAPTPVVGDGNFKNGNFSGTLAAGTIIPGPKTIGAGANQLPASASCFGCMTIVSDAASVTDCTVGSGTTPTLCRSNGLAWIALGAIAKGDVGLSNVTNDAQTKDSIVPNSFAGLRYGNSGGADSTATSAQVQAVIGAGVYDASGAAASVNGFHNRIIDGNFLINQRVYVSGTATGAGVYMHDRWKAGAGGATYTFTQTNGDTTITVTAGTIRQVIEDVNLPEGGTYTLSWTGTATGRVGAGSYAASPITVTGLTAATSAMVEFGTGTVGKVQLEVGSVATPFERRPYGLELALAQRYYIRFLSGGTVSTVLGSGVDATSGLMDFVLPFPVKMMASPTISASSGGSDFFTRTATGVFQNSFYPSPLAAYIRINVGSGLTSGNGDIAGFNNTSAWLDASAEL